MKLQKTDRLISVLIDLDLWTWRQNIRLAGGFTLHVNSIPDEGHGGGRQPLLGGKRRRGRPQKKKSPSSRRRGSQSTQALKRARIDKRLAISTANAARAARPARQFQAKPYKGKRVLKVTSVDVGGAGPSTPKAVPEFPRLAGLEAEVREQEAALAIQRARVFAKDWYVGPCSNRFCRNWSRSAGPTVFCSVHAANLRGS
jgi:hypothetical protein